MMSANLTLPASRSILKPAPSSAENPTMTVSAALNVPPILTLPLTVSRYRLRFIAQEPLRLPAYAGSTWRGAFGHALKRLVCVTREPHCPDCLLYRSCSYPYLFETPPDPAIALLRKYPAAPHPFLLRPPADTRRPLAEGEETPLGLTLFGHGHRYLPYIIHALDQAAAQGLGAPRGRLALAAVEQNVATGWTPIYQPDGPLTPISPQIPEPPPCPERLTLHINTPLRLAVDNDHVTPETFRFTHLFGSLLRRISLLIAFHSDAPLTTDFAALARAADAVPLTAVRLHWRDWNRYSSRQRNTVPMGGLVGEIELNGAGLEPFWPWLWLGQWTHAGKGAVMGLGGYRID
jgi:hypothetical protein